MTNKQKKLLQYIEEYYLDNGEMPLLGDMSNHFEVSHSSIHRRLTKLEDNGYIKRNGKHRNINILKTNNKQIKIENFKDRFFYSDIIPHDTDQNKIEDWLKTNLTD